MRHAKVVRPDSASVWFKPAPYQATGGRVFRFALASAFAITLIFVGSWAAAQLPYGPTDLIVALFTSLPPATTDALLDGALVAALMGFLAGAFFGVAYAALEPLEQL